MIHRHIHKAIKHTFVPHKDNDYKPHFLREHVVLSIVIASILLLLVSVSSYLLIRKTTYGTLVASSVLIDFTNKTREGLGIAPLIKNDLLQSSSMEKAREMATYSYFAHNSPDGTAPWKFFRHAHYDYAFAGENLALNFSTSKQVHEGWLNSPKHRDNIIDPRFKEIGISVLPSSYQEKPVLFVVQHFGLPKGERNIENVPVYSSFFERLLFSGSYYVEMFYFFLIGLIIMAIVLMLVIEVEVRHRLHILYGVLMLVVVVLCTLINAELLS